MLLMIDLLIPTVAQGLLWALMALGVYVTFRVLDIADLTVEGSFPLGAATAASMMVAGYGPMASLFAAFVTGTLAGVIAVFCVAYRADSEHDLDIRIVRLQQRHGAFEVVGAEVYRELFFLKQPCWSFLAVIHYLACLFKSIHVIGAKGEKGDAEHCDAGFVSFVFFLAYHLFHCV